MKNVPPFTPKYQLVSTGNAWKEFKRFLNALPKQAKDELIEYLKNTPSGGKETLLKSKPVRVGRLGVREYLVTGGDRVIYEIIEKEKTVLIHKSGNHDEIKTYLRNFRKH